MADDAADRPVAAGGGVASLLADDGAERPVADGGRGDAGASGSLAGDGAEGRAVANGSAAEFLAAGGGDARPVADDKAEGPVAGAADEDASVGPITEAARPAAGAAGRDASAVGPVAKAGSADNAAKDSQIGQTLPLQGRIAGTTRSRMVA